MEAQHGGQDRSKAELGAKWRLLAAPRLMPVSSAATRPDGPPSSGLWIAASTDPSQS